MTKEDAIKILRDVRDRTRNSRIIEAICTLHPELAESEDERIRKELLAVINDLVLPDEQKARFNDWLEKQKENVEKEYVFRPLAGTDITIAAEQAIRRAMEGDHLVLAFNGWYVPVDKYATTKGLVDSYDTFIEKQKEQKPAERFEEAREKYQVEWSEEDEEMLNLTKTQLSILQSYLPQAHSKSMSDMEYSSQLPQIEKCVSWLDIRFKSLRPSWKPSEEQMKALCKASDLLVSDLNSLYNDLKRLM